jgi:hypothetical protein
VSERKNRVAVEVICALVVYAHKSLHDSLNKKWHNMGDLNAEAQSLLAVAM